MKSFIKITAVCSLLSTLSLSAAITIDFSSPLFEIAKTSAGSPLDNSYTFALGSFGDFIPSSGNTSSWSTNWISIATTSWDSDFSQFTGSVLLSDNSLVASGKDLYIWGYNTQSIGSGTEWVLFDNDNVALGNDEWVVPVASGTPPPKSIGPDQSGTTAIIGSVGTAFQGADPFFQTAAVVPEPAHYAGILGAVALLVGLIRRRK